MALFYFSNTPHAKSKQGEHIDTQKHFDYITREGKYGNTKLHKEELVYSKTGNLPVWANSARDFWGEAEAHRRKNGRAYREIRLALQEEFTLEENIALVDKFLQEAHISTDHVYTYAVHDKTAAFDPIIETFMYISCLMKRRLKKIVLFLLTSFRTISY